MEDKKRISRKLVEFAGKQMFKDIKKKESLKRI